jgi:hypothetical protein
MKKMTFMALLAGLLLPVCATANAQGPFIGQPYQVPPGYEAYGAGTLIRYGGFNYVIQGNGTMLVAQQTGGTSGQRIGGASDAGSSYIYYDRQGTPRYSWDSTQSQPSPMQFPAEALAQGGYRIGAPDGANGDYVRYYDSQGRGLIYYRAQDVPATQPRFQSDVDRWRQRAAWGTAPASSTPYPTQTMPARPRGPSAPSWMKYYNQYQSFVSGVNQYYQQFPGYGGYSGYGGPGSSGGYSGGSSRSFSGSGASDPKRLVVTDPGPK